MTDIISPLLHTVLRGNDPTGHGDYGASRGTRKHKGVDVLAEVGTLVCSPITGFITKFGYAYKDNKKLRYVEIKGNTYRFRLFYTDLLYGRIGQRIMKGEKIGRVQNIAAHWGGGMRNHLHISCWKNGLLTDPEPLIL